MKLDKWSKINAQVHFYYFHIYKRKNQTLFTIHLKQTFNIMKKNASKMLPNNSEESKQYKQNFRSKSNTVHRWNLVLSGAEKVMKCLSTILPCKWGTAGNPWRHTGKWAGAWPPGDGRRFCSMTLQMGNTGDSKVL